MADAKLPPISEGTNARKQLTTLAAQLDAALAEENSIDKQLSRARLDYEQLKSTCLSKMETVRQTIRTIQKELSSVVGAIRPSTAPLAAVAADKAESPMHLRRGSGRLSPEALDARLGPVVWRENIGTNHLVIRREIAQYITNQGAKVHSTELQAWLMSKGLTHGAAKTLAQASKHYCMAQGYKVESAHQRAPWTAYRQSKIADLATAAPAEAERLIADAKASQDAVQ